jgi:Gpi18-like mannosyltransferase
MGASDRGPSVTWRSFGAAGGLLAILGVGLAFRLIIAYVLLPGSGFGTDRDSFIGWAEDLAAHGLYGFYGRVSFIDYTPGYLYVLWLLGIVGNALGGLGDLIKLPAILSDIVVAYLVHQLVLELGGSRRAALIGALIFVVNPVTWFDSAVWAQVDSFGLIFVLLGLRELWRDHPESAAILATIAAVIKPQLGILIPILVAVLVRRYLVDWWRARQAGAPADPAPVGRRSGRLGRGPGRIITAGLAGLVTAAILCAPFGLTVIDLLVQVGKTAGGYPYITVNAFNPWALVEQAGNGLAANGTWLPDIANSVATGTPVTILGIPALFIGTILLLAVILLVCVVVARRDDRRTILVGVTVLAIAFFVVPTRVHERYLFPFFAFGAILAATSYRWRVAYLALVLANFANLYAVLTNPFYNNPGVSDWLGIGDALRSPLGVTLAALTHLIVGLWALTELRGSATARLDAETAAGLADELAADQLAAEEDDANELGPDLAAGAATNEVGEAQPGPGAVAATTFAAGSAGGTAIALGQPGAGPPLAAFSAATIARADRPAADPVIGGPPITTPAVDYESDRGLLRNIFDRRPRLADRSRSLWGEPGGRFDKLDAFIMVVLLIGLLLLRLFRLDAPMEFHFDEVYHARTAMEFLQGWNYGIPHDIYEYTHPHLAKYAIAEGIQYLGDNEVTATAELGGQAKAILVEPRWEDDTLPQSRAGDRFYVAGGDEVRVYDLQTRNQIASYSLPGAQALALDPTNHKVFVGTASGEIASIDTTEELDPLRTSSPPPAPDGTTLPALANLGVGINLLWVSDDGTVLVAGTAASNTVPVDPATGALGPSLHVDGLADLAAAGSVDGLVVTPSAIKDPTAEANAIAAITGLDAAPIEARLKAIATEGGDNALPVLGSFPADKVQAITNGLSGAIGDGRLLGYQVSPLPQVAAAGSAGVTFIAATTGEKIGLVALDAAATGLADVIADTPNLYAAETDKQIAVIPIGDSGTIVPLPSVPPSTFAMPGEVSKLIFNATTKMVHVLGRTPDGSSATIYVVDITGNPPSNATYADAKLPFSPVSWALDATHDYPASDREAILTASPSAEIASVDVGGNPFAWRFPGVVAGVLTAVLMYLLARILFRRRSIAILAGLLVAMDGMFFVQSRIAMNDVYCGLFIVAGYTVFAALWTGWWRWRWAWLVGLPLVGLLLGLALASKWVGLYAIAGVGILILGRSALGRIILILGLIGGTVVLGNVALTAVPVNATTSGPNYFFVVVMVGLTLAAVLHAVLRPVAWTDDETRLAIAGPAILGILVFLGAVALGIATTSYTLGSISVAPVEAAFGLIVASGVVYLIFRLAGSFGMGPLAAPPDSSDPLSQAAPAAEPPPGWMRLGWGFGLPILWMIGTLLVLPLAVYVISYIPWAVSTAGDPQLFPGWPPGHTGQTLLDLTKAMYNYHNTLRAAHPASSPFWAWPLDFKPVWFYQGSFANNTSAAIYDNGNLVTWWLEIPAIAFVAWQAFKRGSLALGLITIGFVLQWVPWMRIDRATFQYHYYTSLPFMVLALAYFLAELWHGASRRTWLLARVSTALVILGPGLLWLFKDPLCAVVGVDRANPGSGACVNSTPGDLLVTIQAAGIAIVMGVAGLVLVFLLLRLRDGATDRQLARVVAVAVAAVAGVVLARLFLPTTPLIDQAGFSTEPIALLIVLVLSPVAYVALTARDARRLVGSILAGGTLFFVVFYPNIAALPLPSTIFNFYQGIIPPWLYPFQFPDNTDVAVAGNPLFTLVPILTGLMLTVLCVVVGYSAWTARIPRLAAGPDGDGPDDDPGDGPPDRPGDDGPPGPGTPLPA